MFERFCGQCKNYKKHDDLFGYCFKYNCQARHDESCGIIKEVVG